MRVAVLGANSELSKDLIMNWAHYSDNVYYLYSRRPDEVASWIEESKISRLARSLRYDEIDSAPACDILINFVGAGNPAKVAAMGSSVVNVTLSYDQLALDYLSKNQACRYLFISSGAVFGSRFDLPVDRDTMAEVTLNRIAASDWYSIAKLLAECRHRSLIGASIVDIRVYSYFSHTQDMSASYLMSEIVRAIRARKTLITRTQNVVRDYIAPSDFAQLVRCMALPSGVNTAIDCFSLKPIDKFTLLECMRTEFGLRYKIQADVESYTTDRKQSYFSVSRKAEEFGYSPQFSSLDSITREMKLLI